MFALGPKDLENRNFSFISFKGAVGVVQILRSTATARDRRKLFFAQIMFISHKKRENQQFFFEIFLETKPLLPSNSKFQPNTKPIESRFFAHSEL
jgi:hypothetical protein